MDAFELIRQGKIRRYFRSTRKLNTPNLVSHITQRAAGKEPLFLEDRDYLAMLGLLKEIAENYFLNVYAFCLMPNHVHLLLSPCQENLYDAMRDLFSRYAVQFNKKYERRGHLFGAPYRQAICLDDSYLLAASLYIHLNPVRAGLVNDLRTYRWSSWVLYCNDDPPKSFVDPDLVLSLLSDGNPDCREQYRQLLEHAGGLEPSHVLEQEDAIERFRAKIASLFPALFKSVDKENNVARFSGLDLLSAAELERQIETVKNNSSLPEPGSRKAKKFLVEQLLARGYKRSEIADRLGVSRKTIYNILKSPS
jgi:putative transposase